ncbi:biotin/lipoyl-containing protein [Nonomuraea zeae]|uniref:Biotin attachment protein n=1 Tax=Nonomuraea zeae TaxID=1642303 RepID=A0A5S4GE73_9ACTN|nr:lipoyl domain-containing protein [Nonomuraea zeae]TMR24380.1 biotin attachment protein [Nonomuraea zeae]
MDIDITLGADALGEEGEGDLAQWLVDDGARVEGGAVIAEIETAKVLTEVLALATSRLLRLVEAGKVIGPDTVIARITDA